MPTPIENQNYILNLILTIFLDPLWQGVNRIMRRSDGAVGILMGVLWILTLGLFGVGWIIDIVTMIKDKTIRIMA